MDHAAHGFGDGIRITRATLRMWNRRPWPVVWRWVRLSLTAAALLLTLVLLVSAVAPGTGPAYLGQPPFRTGDVIDVLEILGHNSLVLLLYALACVAGYIAGASLPVQAEARTGFSRTMHRRAGQLGIAFVVAATVCSLVVQAYTIGTEAADVARSLDTSPALVLLATLPHALPELTALFLPLAAWTGASRHGDWDELLAATAVTVAIALPVLLVCACWEVYGAPHVVLAVVGHG